MQTLIHRWKARPARDPRGWLLVEVAVGGVMAAAIIGMLLVNTGAAMDRTTIASRQMTAVMLAQQAIEQSRAAGTAATSSGNIGVPSGLSGKYTRTRSETSGTTTIGATTISFKEVSVTVSFNTHDYGTKKVTLQTRIYAP
jgi:type II secretory pathway pseudopilin PulG